MIKMSVEKRRVTEIVKKVFAVTQDYTPEETFVALGFILDTIADLNGIKEDMAVNLTDGTGEPSAEVL